MKAATPLAARWLAATAGKADRFARGAVVKAWAALREGRLPASPAWWVRAMRLHWRELDGGWHVVPAPASWDPEPLEASYRRWRETQLAPDRQTALAAAAQRLEAAGPLISVVAWAGDAGRLGEVLETVGAQRYGRWELCVGVPAWASPTADDAGGQGVRDDRRLRLVPAGSPGDEGNALQAVLARAGGEFVAFLGAGDLLPRDALLHVAEALARDPGLDWIYTDEDRVDPDRCHGDPQLKGAFSPELALSHPYATRLAIVRRALVQEVGGLRDGFPAAAAILDLLLRLTERGARVGHVAEVCCHRRATSPETPAVRDGVQRAVEAALARRRLRATPVVPEAAARLGLAIHRLQWDPRLLAEQPVTVVVPTRDRVDLLDACVASLAHTTDARHVRLLVIDDDSEAPATRRYLAELEARGVLRCRVVRSARPRPVFDYARLMNRAAREVETPLMLLLNDDVEAVAPGWLEQMAGWLSIPEVGAVGARLVYPNGALQHAGVVLGARQGLPLHLGHGLDAEEAGYQLLPHLARNVAAVTGACLLTPTALFHELGGFDAMHLSVQYNDIDYCLRVLDAGRRVVYEPGAVLIHRGGASRGRAYDYRENLFFLRKHRSRRDPYVSPHLDPGSLCGPSPRLRTP